MGVCLMKTHIRVAIAVLDIDYLVTDNIYASTALSFKIKVET